MRFPDLQDLSDQASLYCALSQTYLSDHLDEHLGAHRWEADMHTRRLSFVSEEHDGRIDTRLSMVATLAPGPRSMLWGWSHPQYDDGYAARLREHGEAHGIASLVTPEVPLETDVPGTTGEALADEIAVAAHLVGQVAVQVTGDAPYYSAPLGGGSRAVLMLSDHDLPRPRIDHRIARVATAFGALPIHDHRRAFHGLAVLADWLVAWDDAHTSAELVDPVTGNAVTVTFDDHARFSSMSTRLGPA